MKNLLIALLMFGLFAGAVLAAQGGGGGGASRGIYSSGRISTNTYPLTTIVTLPAESRMIEVTNFSAASTLLVTISGQTFEVDPAVRTVRRFFVAASSIIIQGKADAVQVVTAEVLSIQ